MKRFIKLNEVVAIKPVKETRVRYINVFSVDSIKKDGQHTVVNTHSDAVWVTNEPDDIISMIEEAMS